MPDRPPAAAAPSRGWRAFVELSKPEITAVVVLTVLAGFLAASPDGLALGRLTLALVGTALASAGTGALNMLVERESDARMSRTGRRPLPTGRVSPAAALRFGLVTLLAGLVLLAAGVNALAAGLAALTSLVYLFVYAPLKRVSAACVLIGAVPGALPPVIGAAAAAGRLGGEAVVLFLIQFLWQVPHLTAIAWLSRADYARVGWRMLPAPDPDGARAARRVLGYGIALTAASLLPAYLDATGRIYLMGAVTLGFLFFLLEVRFWIDRTVQAARWVFAASMVYLPALLLLFAIDRRPPG